jgi:hypothetical protein
MVTICATVYLYFSKISTDMNFTAAEFNLNPLIKIKLECENFQFVQV